ncbi:PepSY domain-containing protein [Chryseomicrobium palamuruense]|uniref:PepSY domain-containing protein n=1 Tax=Chryseomicrobium palamuruense TaxID=682973 RepID=A0ABV8UXL6_9BACL
MNLTKTNKWVIGAAAVGALAIGGVALADDRDDLVNVIPVTQNSADFIGEERAKEIAAETGKGDIVSFSLDTDDGRAHYDVEMKDGQLQYEFDIDAVTGDVRDYEEDREDDDSNATNNGTVTSATDQKMLTQDEAVAKVQDRVSGTLTKFELDDNQYELEFRDGSTEYEIEMNPYTGDIIEFEKDND